MVGTIIDVSGESIEPPDEDDQGNVWLETYKHDLSFAARKFRATILALGTGTALTTVNFISNTRPPPATAADQIWYKPSNGHYHISDADGIWFNTDFGFDTTLAALGLPGTGYTDAVDIGQYDTAGEAANAIPAADYAATTQYVFYNRDTTDVEYLSAYTAPGSQVEYWDIVHVLTDENRITPHPVADKYEVAALTAVARFEDTSILLPEIGWIDLVGFVAATGRFALHIPVSLIRGLSVAAAGDETDVATSSAHFATGHAMTVAKVHFGHTTAGNLLISSGMAGAVEVSAYN